eukprot:m.1281026 g.1281026  ORF g.1281026 m.1281026 type:complete len:55 (+) comp24769_c0_seq39:154-318(+)
MMQQPLTSAHSERGKHPALCLRYVCINVACCDLGHGTTNSGPYEHVHEHVWGTP